MAVTRVSSTEARNWISAPGFFVRGRAGDPKRNDYSVMHGDSLRMVAATWRSQIIGMSDMDDHEAKEKDEGTMASTQEQLDEAASEVTAAYERFAAAREKLKGSLKNDTVAASAAATKIRMEMEKIVQSVQASLAVLLSDDMQRAVEQAERLAAALRSISELRTTKLALALFDQTPTKAE